MKCQRQRPLFRVVTTVMVVVNNVICLRADGRVLGNEGSSLRKAIMWFQELGYLQESPALMEQCLKRTICESTAQPLK
jgi:hypothetical protein